MLASDSIIVNAWGAGEENKLIMDRLCVRGTRAFHFNEEICIFH